LNQKDVESCPEKDAIFQVIRTWENARSANAFPKDIKRELVNPEKSWRLKEVDSNTWTLYELTGGSWSNERTLTRAEGY